MPKVSSLASRRPGGASPEPTRRTERPVTFRLDEPRLSLITALALLDETTVAEQIRVASESYVRARTNDPDLKAKVAAAEARFRSELAVLTADGGESAPEHPEPPVRDTRSEKPVTLRLAQQIVTIFTSLALLDGGTLADQLRAAVDAYVRERQEDPELSHRVIAARQEHADLMALLSPTG